MMPSKEYLAIDIGASSGRHILGHIKNGKIEYQEIHRFTNSCIRQNNHDCWDLDALLCSIKEGIDKTIESGYHPTSLAIDTWGVDFVLLDENLNLCAKAIAYRDNRTNGIPEYVDTIISPDKLYQKTGIQRISFNTIYQLIALQKEEPQAIKRARHLLMVPEYLTYKLTGKIFHEYTISSTTGLLNAQTRTWDYDLIASLGLPTQIFGELSMPGTLAGTYKGIDVILPAMHDTASAYLAVPAQDENAVYLSSGTWSLIGAPQNAPITTQAALRANFTNEGGAYGTYRFLKNIMGLWVIQSLRRELNQEEYVKGRSTTLRDQALATLTDYQKGHNYTFQFLAQLATTYTPDVPTIDIAKDSFLNPPSMLAKIIEESHLTTISGITKCLYKSLATCYKNAITELSQITNRTYHTLNIVGGGSQDATLNAITQEITQIPVIPGPTEATAIGNFIVQMIQAQELSSLNEARKAIIK